MDDQSRTRELRRLVHARKEEHARKIESELVRLTNEAIALGVSKIVLFGSLTRGSPGLTSDIDLLIVWNTDLDHLARTAELYRRLKPRVAVDLFVYTPREIQASTSGGFVQTAIREGRILYAA
jgi:uncharacterized protein